MKCGLLGRKLGHSYSPVIHSHLGTYTYSLFETEPEELECFLRNGDYSGLNVTVPYKKAVIPFLDELTPIAQKLGAVNTIVRQNGRLIGHNTDYFGFSAMMDSCKVGVSGKKALVLGSGGASNTAKAVLTERGAEVIVISRSGEDNYNNLEKHKDAFLIVNTTPVGMYPGNGESPIDLNRFPSLAAVLDVIYNPARTRLLLDAEKRGLVTSNGLLMLVAQAKEAAEWFTGSAIDENRINTIYHKLSVHMQNIILIGMPGCGKSTVGKLLAEQTGRTFADADDRIIKLAGKSIPRIFAEDGEEVFRHWETRALNELGRQSGLVIATGGGCVTRNRNYDLLHQNGILCFMKRELKTLPTEGRPLSAAGNLEQMYRIRKPMYLEFCDFEISNDQTPEDTVHNMLKYLEDLQ